MREVTLTGAAPNVFRFAADLSQQVAGLGTYAFRDLGWRTATVVVEDNEIGWGEAAGFLAEFCALGGRAAQFPLTPDLTPPPAPDSDGVAMFVTPFGKSPEAIAAFAGGRLPLESALLLGPGSWSGVADLSALPPDLRQVVTVEPAFSATAGSAYREALARFIPGATQTDALQPYLLQNHDSMEAVLLALERTGGSIGPGGADLREALRTLQADLVSGPVHLDANRAAVVSTALVRLGDVGSTAVIRTLPEVDQTFGGTLPADYQPMSGEQPCEPGLPPPWAR